MLEIISARVSSVSIFGEATGAISATVVDNASGPVRVSWTSSNGASTITEQTLDAKQHLLAGIYRLTVQDDHDQASINYTIQQNRPLKIIPGAVTDVLVFGQKTGAIARTAMSGGDGSYSVYWQSQALDMTADHSLQPKLNLYSSDYTVTIVDGVGARASYTYTVNQTHQLQIHGGAVRNASINGLSGGYIEACEITGGVLPYSYLWNSEHRTTAMAPVVLDAYNAYTVPELTDLRPGLYELVVADASGAVARRAFNVREGPNKLYHQYGSSRNFISNSD